MRWLSHRGGALDFREWKIAHPCENFPIAVALGADPATILGAVTPVPDTLSEYAFARVERGRHAAVPKVCRAYERQRLVATLESEQPPPPYQPPFNGSSLWRDPGGLSWKTHSNLATGKVN